MNIYTGRPSRSVSKVGEPTQTLEGVGAVVHCTRATSEGARVQLRPRILDISPGVPPPAVSSSVVLGSRRPEAARTRVGSEISKAINNNFIQFFLLKKFPRNFREISEKFPRKFSSTFPQLFRSRETPFPQF